MTTIVGAGGLVSRASRYRCNAMLRLYDSYVALNMTVNARLSSH